MRRFVIADVAPVTLTLCTGMCVPLQFQSYLVEYSGRIMLSLSLPTSELDSQMGPLQGNEKRKEI